ncbi:unannotated protein [freshwater metagenome]|uniref:Unannotated protein n=1 Tax=freshwater metagenome TaxID=449393 RepID=A0A6J6TXL2_9ZZZZ
MRGPSMPSAAGRVMIAPMTAKATAEIPANAKERRKYCGKKSIDARVTATVRPENTTVRPADETVRMTASSTERPAPVSSLAANSSRNRLTTSNA